MKAALPEQSRKILSSKEMNFARFTSEATARKQVVEHVSALQADLEGVRRLAARSRFAFLPVASCCIFRNSRHAQSQKRGVELPRLRHRAFGGGLATKTKKTCLEQKLLQLACFSPPQLFHWRRLRIISLCNPATRGPFEAQQDGSTALPRRSKFRVRSAFATRIIRR